MERLSRSLFHQDFISSVKFLEFSFEYFPQYVYSFFFVSNLVLQRKRNVFKATSTLVKKKCKMLKLHRLGEGFISFSHTN